MTTDDTPRTPLTLEFSPEPLEDDNLSLPIIFVEPSFQHGGRIFIGVNPFGKRLGLHLLPHDARKLRDHLSKLLLEPGEDGLKDDFSPTDWKKRIEEAAARAKKIKRPLNHFRFEAQIGRFVIVLGTTQSE